MIEIIQRHIIPAAYTLLPEPMASPAATAMLLAIGLQESQFRWRKQISGPARGFWQFERGGGIKGVVTHPDTRAALRSALVALRYEVLIGQTVTLHQAVEDNDVLACVFARLLLWTLPGRLPTREEPSEGWAQYLDGWRPGKPHPATWDHNFAIAWACVDRVVTETEP